MTDDDFGISDEDGEGEPGSLLPLGEPPFGDIEAAARLYARYSKEAPLLPEGTRSFLMMVADPDAVLKRARELLKT